MPISAAVPPKKPISQCGHVMDVTILTFSPDGTTLAHQDRMTKPYGFGG